VDEGGRSDVLGPISGAHLPPQRFGHQAVRLGHLVGDLDLGGDLQRATRRPPGRCRVGLGEPDLGLQQERFDLAGAMAHGGGP